MASNVAALKYWIAGAAVVASGLYSCPFHAATGLYCPGCGMTRATLALVSGNVQLAVHQNILLVIAPFLIWLYQYNRSRRLVSDNIIIIVAALLMIAFTFARNVPNSGLAPS